MNGAGVTRKRVALPLPVTSVNVAFEWHMWILKKHAFHVITGILFYFVYLRYVVKIVQQYWFL